jgi:hypothetical protein
MTSYEYKVYYCLIVSVKTQDKWLVMNTKYISV